ncbi:GIY-YIG nuclease family protein [Alteromonas lipolytica]|uniref:GIY-YIG domain-containing protein n=1 Tax=Alteromonas lipolytica TaxID=1856405 RepID=A0A1E8FDP6_9ALTE|nr:GIY-YIG nuclease family protein [Alteromonas lipolytica]OFI34041.1 hypothetical protein BFC17_21055 [Alteromonas lipolytica]GGF65967.1 hypothetical protein GCM10011338_17860 [Alteromonas lipolytica]
MSQWYVYLIRTGNNTLYTGITTDPKRRIRQHRGEIKGGAKALRGKTPLKYHCIFAVTDKSQALKLEIWIKKRTRKEKEAVNKVAELPLPATLLDKDATRQMNSEHH